MSDLAEKKCVPCEGGLPPLDYKEIHKYLKKVNGWNVKTNENKNYFIEKEFIFKNFIESQKFVNLVGEISEKEGHHPDIAFGWGYARIKILTHAVKGAIDAALECKKNGQSKTILFNLCGHGHFDMQAYGDYFDNKLEEDTYNEAAVNKALQSLPKIT